MNHYETLGVPKTASQAEIKEAYKALVKKYHPDIYPGDKIFAEKKIKEINNAYDVLSDEAEKQKYDAEINPRPTYNYSPPNYTYTPPKYDYSSSKYSYENYKKTYKTSGYEYEKRYTDYHRSKTPNSNYTSASSKVNDFHDNITNNVTNTFSGLNLQNKFIVLIAIFLIYLVLLVTTFIETDAILNRKQYETISSTKESTSSQEVEDEKTQSSTFSKPSREEFNINDYYSNERHKELYLKGYYTNFETFSEFKEYFEDFVYEYYYSY